MKRWIARMASWGVCLMMLTGMTGIQGQAAEMPSENHAYVPYEWCSRDIGEKKIEQRLDTLQEYGIRYLYCDIGCYRVSASGNLSNSIAYEGLGRWIRAAHERGMRVLACINYAMSYGELERPEGGTFHDIIQEDILRISEIFVKSGVECDGATYTADGVQMDVEPFRASYQEAYLQLMRAVRETVGAEPMIGIATPARNRLWSEEYAAQIIELADLLSPMIYDSVGPVSWGGVSAGVTRTRDQYIALTVNTCVWYAEQIAHSSNPDCLLSVTVPVYDDRKSAGSPGYPDADSGEIYYHLNYNKATGETLETLENCLIGVRRAMEQGAKVDGAGVFYWPSFLGEDTKYKPSRNLYYDFEADQRAWKALWLNGEEAAETTDTSTETTEGPSDAPGDRTTEATEVTGAAGTDGTSVNGADGTTAPDTDTPAESHRGLWWKISAGVAAAAAAAAAVVLGKRRKDCR